jgi:tetratricopeptide (TPR) repeat protein
MMAQALDAAGHAKELASGQPPAWRALAIFYAEAKNFSEAAACEEKWSRASPSDSGSNARAADYHVLAGKAYREMRNPAKAIESFQHAMRLAPERKTPYFELAALLLDHRTPEPAVMILESAVTRFTTDAEFRRLLGLAYYQLGDITKAIDSFLSVCDLEPDSEIGYASLETLLTEAGSRLPEILGRFQSFAKRRSDNPVGLYLTARALAAGNGSSMQVEAALRKAIKSDAAFWPAHYELGQYLEAEGKLEEALRSLSEAARLNPQYAPVHFAMARLYTRVGDRGKAIEHRKIHGGLLAREREVASRARAESPALRYRMEAKGR